MNRTVVVIEDNPDNLALMVALLERRWTVVTCEDPHAAITVVRDERPAVVLLDIGLPGLDGPAILDLIRADATVTATPVVAVTADVRRESDDHWRRRGFDGFIAKPIVDKTVLWSLIDSFVATVETCNGTEDARDVDANGSAPTRLH